MNYQQLISTLRKNYDNGEAQAIAKLLADKVLNMSFVDMLCADSLENCSNCGGTPPISATAFSDIITRISNGEPIQYILGEENFFGRTFLVGNGVLIPRPETEELCLWIINEIKAQAATVPQTATVPCGFAAGPTSVPQAATVPEGSPSGVLDIGTGSGAIAITLAKELPNASVSAIDISEKALYFARKNAEQLEATVNFIQADILSPGNLPIKPASLSVIVSNPPYIMEKEQKDMSAHVLDHEPPLALFVPDNDPLLFYRTIADYALLHLQNGGLLFFEINPLCAEEMLTMLHEKGFADIELREDQFGKKRMIKAVKK